MLQNLSPELTQLIRFATEEYPIDKSPGLVMPNGCMHFLAELQVSENGGLIRTVSDVGTANAQTKIWTIVDLVQALKPMVDLTTGCETAQEEQPLQLCFQW